MSLLTLFPFNQPLDDNGDIVPGGKLTFYEAGTVFKKDTYADAQGDVTNSNPAVLDIDTGRKFIFMGNDGAYDVIFTDADDNEIWSLSAFMPYAPVTDTGTSSTSTSGVEGGGDTTPLRLIGEGDSLKLIHTAAGGAMYGEDIAENYSLGAFDPVDGSGLTQRFLRAFFKTLYAQAISVMDATGADVVQALALAVDGSIAFGSGRDVTSTATVTAAQLATPGCLFSELPASPVAGMHAYITDSDTDVWGAAITGGAATKVLAFYNGTDWTVAGK